jgi:hypothetical protein
MDFIIFMLHHISLGCQVKEDEMGRCLVHLRKMRNAYKVLIRTSEGKRQLQKLGCGWKDNIKLDHREIWGGCGLDLPVSE